MKLKNIALLLMIVVSANNTYAADFICSRDGGDTVRAGSMDAYGYIQVNNYNRRVADMQVLDDALALALKQTCPNVDLTIDSCINKAS